MTPSAEFQRALSIAQAARLRTGVKSTRGARARAAHDWANLPEPLLTAVFENAVLSTKDKLRAALVCGAWGVTALSCRAAWETIQVVPPFPTFLSASTLHAGALTRTSRFFGHVAETMDLRFYGGAFATRREEHEVNLVLQHAATGPSVTKVLLPAKLMVKEVVYKPVADGEPTLGLRVTNQVRLRDVSGGPLFCEVRAWMRRISLYAETAPVAPAEWLLPENAVVRVVTILHSRVRVTVALLDPKDLAHASLLAHIRLAVHCAGRKLFALNDHLVTQGPLFTTADAPGLVALHLCMPDADKRPTTFRLGTPTAEAWDVSLKRFVLNIRAYVVGCECCCGFAVACAA